MLDADLATLLDKLGIRGRCEPLLEEEAITELSLLETMGDYVVQNLVDIGFTNADAEALAKAASAGAGADDDDDDLVMEANEVAAIAGIAGAAYIAAGDDPIDDPVIEDNGDESDGLVMEENEEDGPVMEDNGTAAAPAPAPPSSKPMVPSPAPAPAAGRATTAAHRGPTNYSKWDAFDSDDDDDDDGPVAFQKSVRQEYEVVIQAVKVRERPKLDGEIIDYKKQGARFMTDRETADGWVRLSEKVRGSKRGWCLVDGKALSLPLLLRKVRHTVPHTPHGVSIVSTAPPQRDAMPNFPLGGAWTPSRPLSPPFAGSLKQPSSLRLTRWRATARQARMRRKPSSPRLRRRRSTSRSPPDRNRASPSHRCRSQSR